MTLFEQYKCLKSDDPAALLLLRDEGRYVAFGLDADAVAHIAFLDKTFIFGHPSVEFPCRELARSLVALRKAHFRVAVADSLSLLLIASRPVAAGGVKVA